jgi:molybdate transport system substrate-binding protein
MQQLRFAIIAVALACAACSQERVEFQAPAAGAAAKQEPAALRVGAAASLREVAEEIGKHFGERRSGARVEFAFGASNELAAQLRAGAPLDLLMSADEAIPRGLEEEGLAGYSRPFAGNRLVVVARSEVGSRLTQPADLVGEAVGRIAMPSPAVPVGHYARAWLSRLGLLQAAEARIVQTENVRATLAAVDAGNADAAIVYATDAQVAGSAKVAFEIPDAEQPRIVYVVTLAKASRHMASRDFVDFLVGAEGLRILKEAGFSAPPAP